MTNRFEDRQFLAEAPERASLLLLGPVQLYADGAEVPLGGPVQRGVLAALAIHAGHPVAVDRLLTEVWGDETPDRTRRSLATLVSRLRTVLEPLGATVEHRQGAYVLLGSPDTDLAQFDRLSSAAADEEANGDLLAAITTLERAMALWRGLPMANIDAPFATDQRARLIEERRTVEERMVALLLATDDPARAVVLLEAMVRETPYSEHRWADLIDALHATGRRRDALRAYQQVDRMLREDLGIGAGPLLRAAEQRVLVDDITPDAGATEVIVAAADGRSVGANGAGRPPSALVGRTTELNRIIRLLDSATDVNAPQRGPIDPDVLLLAGPPGIGKTALLCAATTATRRLRQVIAGSCHVGAGSIASAMLHPIVELLLNPVPAPDAESAEHPSEATKVSSTASGAELTGVGDALDDLGPEGADLRRLVTPGIGFDPLLLGMLEQRILAAVGVAVDALLRRGPLAIAIDDIHWADPLTRRAIDDLLDRPTTERVVLLLTGGSPVTSDDEWVESLGPRSDVDVVELAPLDDDAVADIVTAAGIVGAEVDAIVDAAGGLPLLAVELIRLVTDRRDSLRGEVPDRLRRVLDLRFATLPDQAGRLVRLASLERFATPQIRIGAALGLDAPQTTELLDAAVSVGAIRIDEVGGVEFTHDLIRTYFLEQMGERSVAAARRALLQAHIAADDHLATAGQAEQLAGFTGVGAIDPQERVEHLVRGAAAARDVGATDDAKRWIEAALSASDVLPRAVGPVHDGSHDDGSDVPEFTLRRMQRARGAPRAD